MRISGTDLYIPQGDTTKLIIDAESDLNNHNFYMFTQGKIIEGIKEGEKVTFLIDESLTLNSGKFYYDIFMRDGGSAIIDHRDPNYSNPVNIQTDISKIDKKNLCVIVSLFNEYTDFSINNELAVFNGMPQGEWTFEDEGSSYYFKRVVDEPLAYEWRAYLEEGGQNDKNTLRDISMIDVVAKFLFFEKTALKTIISKSSFVVEGGVAKENFSPVLKGQNPEEKL